MNQFPEFVSQLATVVIGVFLFVMTAAFVLLPYSMSAHPGETPIHAASGPYHSS